MAVVLVDELPQEGNQAPRIRDGQVGQPARGPGRVLLVDPVHKPAWTCRPPGPVLAVDWVPSRPERAEGLIIVYDGGILPPEEIERSIHADGELAGL